MSASQALSEVMWSAPRTDRRQPQISPEEAASLATMLDFDAPDDDLFARTVHEYAGEAFWAHTITRLQSELVFLLWSPDDSAAVSRSWTASHAGLIREVALLHAVRSRVGGTEGSVGDTSTLHQATGLGSARLYATAATYRGRLEQLRQFARDDGESVNEVSVRRFFAFLRDYRVVKRASLVLSNANDLCARWRNDDGKQEINAEFLADGRVLWTAVVDGEHQDARTSSYEEFIRDVRAAGLEALLHG